MDNFDSRTEVSALDNSPTIAWRPPLRHSLDSSVLRHASPPSSGNTNTAALLQSAAKAALDATKTNTSRRASQNDGNDHAVDHIDDYNDNDDEDDNVYRSSRLYSLQHKSLPAIPDEQDRRRFVGALAAVLASLYDSHHVCNDVDTSRMSMSDESRMSIDPDEIDNYNCNDDNDAIMQSQSCDSLYSESTRSFDNMTDTSYPTQQQQQQQPVRRSSVQITSGKQTFVYRCRKRRYEVLSKLLISASDYLMLEKSQSKAFVPMLSKILTPDVRANNVPPRHNARSSNSYPGQRRQRSQSSSSSAARISVWREKVASIPHLQPFLESMTPGSGMRCLALFLIQHLLHCPDGYDARVRHAVKTLGVILLCHDMSAYGGDRDDVSASQVDIVSRATRKFESLEQNVAQKLLLLSKQQQKVRNGRNQRQEKSHYPSVLTKSVSQWTRRDILRGVKIGGTAVVAGTLFAVTGGLAAPGIAASVAALAGGTAATAAAVFTSTAAVTAIFGVGGGGLAAYKMQRRTQGLTEFHFCKELGKNGESYSSYQNDNSKPVEAELFSTICLSGWVRDAYDFQRPWGVVPSRPPLKSRQELLERFYAIYSPDHVSRVPKILESWKDEEVKLWELLRQKYGRDPHHLFPLETGPKLDALLTLEETELVDNIFEEIGFEVQQTASGMYRGKMTPIERMRIDDQTKRQPAATANRSIARCKLDDRYGSFDSLHGPHLTESRSFADVSSATSSTVESTSTIASTAQLDRQSAAVIAGGKDAKLINPVWDFQSRYGGELYTIRWESEMLLELCDSVADMAVDIVSGGAAQLLRHTALSTLFSAVALPYALVNAANMIDGTWTLAVERADEAGKELARSLLLSRAGNRPVTLVGFSFGARAIYACLKELARYQEEWEYHRLGKNTKKDRTRRRMDIEKLHEGSDEFYECIREPSSVVEDVILMGLPNHLSLDSWKACRQVVGGRFVNCYSQKDLILSLMFQLKRFGLKRVCGTCPVLVDGVENVDVTDLIRGHQDYCFAVGEILERVKFGQPFTTIDKTTDSSNNNCSSNDVSGLVESDSADMSHEKYNI